MPRPRVLSGIQPSGALHLGNYFGMMKRMIHHQASSDLYCFLVNYHAMTTVTDAAELRRNTLRAAGDFLAIGLDPEQSTFWVQSDVPEVTELTWILGNVTTVGLLERAHSYKDKVARGVIPHHGLFSYPVLMAADILLYGGEIVPVGKDQKQHLEITRDIAIRFNQTYGETFVVPEPLIEDGFAVVPGLDGQKMSKSYGNTIDIFSDREELSRKVMSIVTDKTPVDQPKDPDTSTLFQIYSLFLDEPARAELSERFRTPGLRYSEAKRDLVEIIWDHFAPYRDRKAHYDQRPAEVTEVLEMGAAKARTTAREILDRARAAVGLNYTRG